MTTPADRVLHALREHGIEPKRSGTGWSCRCPAHDDRNPSLSIARGGDGRALIHCHAGCSAEAVAGALGLRPADLFTPDPGRSGGRGRNGHAPRTRQRVTVTETPANAGKDKGSGDGDARAFPTARDAVAELERRHGPRSMTWTYHSADGDPVGLVLRWDRPDGKKDIRPVSRKADGSGWIIGGMPETRPLYGLPDLLATPAGSRVFVVEGEKAADAARAVGLPATTSPHGSKSAGKADWSPLAGRDVVILPDHDQAGERYAADVARLARASGAASVRVVRLADLWPEMPEGGDIADLLGHRGGDIDPIREEIEALASKAEPEAGPVRHDTPAIPAYTPFPTDALPEPIRTFVTEAARAIVCDPSYIALPLLSGLASAIGNTHRIGLKRGWADPAIIWTAIVGDSGTMKTPAFKLAMKAIRKAQDAAFKEYQEAEKEWKKEILLYEAELARWKRQAAKGHGDAGDPPEEPPRPVARRYIVSDTTTEALAPILMNNPRGVLLARDELAGWLGSFDRYAKAGKVGADASHWLSMHNGESMTIDRKTGEPRTIHVPSASVSLTGGIQPGILSRALGREHHESGMAARLLFSMPPRRVKKWTEAEVGSNTEAAVAAVFDRLYDLTPKTGGGDDDDEYEPWLVQLTDDGKTAWVRFYEEHATEQAQLTGDLSAAWSKLEGYAARLALVVHLTRWAAGDDTPRDRLRVDEASVAAGVALSRWFGAEARRVYAILAENDDDREARQLAEWIERKGGEVTARDLTHGVRAFRGDPDAAERALSGLAEAGMGHWENDAHGPKGGRPARRFRLVSTVTVTETTESIGVEGGSGDGDTGDAPTDAGDGWGEL